MTDLSPAISHTPRLQQSKIWTFAYNLIETDLSEEIAHLIKSLLYRKLATGLMDSKRKILFVFFHKPKCGQQKVRQRTTFEFFVMAN